jgi:hypothetical protein
MFTFSGLLVAVYIIAVNNHIDKLHCPVAESVSAPLQNSQSRVRPCSRNPMVLLTLELWNSTIDIGSKW